jgi:hypothetical protein
MPWDCQMEKKAVTAMGSYDAAPIGSKEARLEIKRPKKVASWVRERNGSGPSDELPRGSPGTILAGGKSWISPKSITPSRGLIVKRFHYGHQRLKGWLMDLSDGCW